MYSEFYSLERPPFRITPDPSLFYTGGENGRGVVLEALLYAVMSGEGILKVVGEVGSGKTMLCRMLEERLPDSVEVVYLANPNLSPHDILYAIAFELKLPVDNSTQRFLLMLHLQEYLLKQHAANRKVVVMIEEAQSMPLETLEEVRLFSNLETHQHKLMQIVLFGQPELDKNLQDKSIRQLRERITHSFNLRPLSVDEVRDYIRFRLQAAGCPSPQLFSPAAEKLIARASGGLTRRINILADKAMLAAYAESAAGPRPRTIDNFLQPTVLPKHVRAAIADSGYKPAFWSTGRQILAYSLLGGALIAGLLFWWLAAGFFPQVIEARESPLNSPRPQEIAPETVAVEQSSPVPVTAVPEAEPATVAAILQTNTPVTGAVTPVAEQPEPEAPVAPEEAFEQAVLEDAVLEEAALEETALAEAAVEEAVQPVADVTPLAVAVPVSDATSAVPLEPAQSSAASAELAVGSLLRARTAATKAWLQGSDPASYIVQLLSVNSGETAYVSRVLERLQQFNLLENTYSCLFSSDGQEYWKVIYGSFSSLEGAREFIANLPESIRSNSPYVQNIRRLNCNLAAQI